MRLRRPRPLTGRPSVSVVIPCYNYGRYLPDAVASAFDGNDAVDVDVVIVDDRSTDDSVSVARSLAASDRRIQVLEHESNLGHIRTYNDGLARARGDNVVLLSADDLLTPGSLSRSAALLQHQPDVGLVYGYPASFTGSPAGVDLRARRRVSWSTWRGVAWSARVCARGRNIIVNPEVMMRRSLLESIGGYDARHPHAADLKLWMQAAGRMDVGRVNGPVQALYREHGANMHHTTYGGVLVDLQESCKAFEDVFAEDRLPRAFVSRARRALAREAMLRARLAQAEHDSDVEERASLVAFARETWPSVVRGRLWRSYERREVRGALPGEVGVARWANRARWMVRWQRWRVFGT